MAQVSRYPVGLTRMQEGEKKSHKVIPFEEKKNAILLACHDKASEIPIIQVTLLIGAPVKMSTCFVKTVAHQSRHPSVP